jgi:three-Cys-motif partner protein
VVALRRPDDLGPPPSDGLLLREIAEHGTQKTYYHCRYTETAATATKGIFRGSRAYADMYCGPGVCIDKDTSALSWGSALLALQVSNPFDLYFFNDYDATATAALAERVKAIGLAGAVVFEIDLRKADALDRARSLASVDTLGPKIVISTGDANKAPLFLHALLDGLGHRRYLLAFIDPLSATFHWKSFEALAMYEKAMDVLSLFPDGMDLSRNFGYYLNNAKAGAKLDAYFDCDWRQIVQANPQRAEHELRVLYEKRMETILGFNIGRPKGVGMTSRALYHLVFGSKSEFGMKLWNNVNSRTPSGQDELFLDGV